MKWLLNFPLIKYSFSKLYIRSILICSLHSYCIIAMFDSTSNNGIENTPFHIIVICSITAICEMLVIYLAPFIFDNNHKRWSLYSEFQFYLMLLFILSSTLFLIGVGFDFFAISFLNMLKVVWFVFFKGLFPISLLMIVKFIKTINFLSKKISPYNFMNDNVDYLDIIE
jgi:hypothetical protein